MRALFVLCVLGSSVCLGCGGAVVSPTNWYYRDSTVNWDAEAKPIDTIVIHHSASEQDITWQEISQIQHRQLFVTRYRLEIEPFVKGEEPHSGHYRAIRDELVEVFYNYHWLIRADGTQERLLPDREIGWHAGNWEVNCRSVALCFTGDFTKGQPTEAALDSCVELIVEYMKKFPAIKLQSVIGHREVNPKTECPGNDFLGENGWKNFLLQKIKEIRQKIGSIE